MEKCQRQIENKEKRKKWKMHIEAWEESGITQTEYCRIHGLNAGQFTYYKSQRKRKAGTNTLVPIQINPDLFPSEPPGGSKLRLNIENGFQIEIENDFDPSLLTALIRTVRGM
jgi:transposase